MFHTSITIDLPSEPVLRRGTLLDWLAKMLGRTVDLESQREVCTATGVSVFKAVTDALAQAAITDLLSVTVDRKTAYVDTEENSGDLAAAVAELDARGALEREFESMGLVLMHREDELRTLVEVNLERRVELGTPELQVHIASRHDPMQVRKGEGPSAYASRLRALACDDAALVRAHARSTELSATVEQALRTTLGALALASTRSPVQLRLIRPGPRQLDRLRSLSWGSAVRPPRYRPVPIHTRRGAYEGPFFAHYFDPYFDFAAYVTLCEIVAGRGWPSLDYVILDTDASVAFDAQQARGQAPFAGEFERGPVEQLVHIGELSLTISEAVPHTDEAGPGEFTLPREAPGFAGNEAAIHSGREAWQPVSGGASEAGVSGGELGGSCGASCGGCGGA